jgi:hypothetical protein
MAAPRTLKDPRGPERATAKHILCIVEGCGAALQPGRGAWQCAHLYAIPYRDIAAIVREVALPAAQPTRQDMVEHFRLLEQMMATETLIPVAFGTIAGSDEEVIRDLLAAHYEEWQVLLNHLAGKVELGLKVLWREMKAVFAEVVAERDNIRALRERLTAVGQPPSLRPTATYHERIEIGRLVAEALNEKKHQEAEGILAALAPLAAETHRGKLFGDNMILNAAFLVARERETELDDAVSCLAQEHGRRLVFRYVGPAPPFSFVRATQALASRTLLGKPELASGQPFELGGKQSWDC